MRRACAWCGRELPPSDAEPGEGIPADFISHDICGECEARINAELEADAGNGAGSETPGPAQSDTMDSRHRRPGDRCIDRGGATCSSRGTPRVDAEPRPVSASVGPAGGGMASGGMLLAGRIRAATRDNPRVMGRPLAGLIERDTDGNQIGQREADTGSQEGGNLADGRTPTDGLRAARGSKLQPVQVRHSPPRGLSHAERRALLAPAEEE